MFRPRGRSSRRIGAQIQVWGRPKKSNASRLARLRFGVKRHAFHGLRINRHSKRGNVIGRQPAA